MNNKKNETYLLDPLWELLDGLGKSTGVVSLKGHLESWVVEFFYELTCHKRFGVRLWCEFLTVSRFYTQPGEPTAGWCMESVSSTGLQPEEGVN